MTTTRICKKCGIEKPIDQYFRNKAMIHSGGRLLSCKSCVAKTQREYDRTPRAKELSKERMKKSKFKIKSARSLKRQRAKYPEKYHARNLLYSALKLGKINREPCSVCGNPKSEAHHQDYNEPLKVMWLCFEHHRELHKQAA
jgi:DNA repair exonuclease SbcCD ATPase subunit